MQAFWVHTQPMAELDNREDPHTHPVAQGPVNLWRPLLVQASQELHTSHSTQEAREKAEGYLG